MRSASEGHDQHDAEVLEADRECTGRRRPRLRYPRGQPSRMNKPDLGRDATKIQALGNGCPVMSADDARERSVMSHG